MLSIEEARLAILAHLTRGELEEVPLPAAWGRVLGEAVVADGDFPSGDRGIMDGYAIGLAESPGSFRVIGEIRAGDVPDRPLSGGEAFRIFTGALVPDGAGRVIPQELVRREGEIAHIDEFPESLFIRERGSEVRRNETVLRAGVRLGAAELAILAQIGNVRPKVVKLPVIRHLATGSELVAPDQLPVPGKIRDSNSSLIAGLLAGLGTPVAESFRVADDPRLIQELAEGNQDLLLISGGAGGGDHDFGTEVLERLGFRIHFNRLNLRPGKPLVFATRGKQAAFVVPGNPVSHFVTFHVAIRLALEILLGIVPRWHFQQIELRDGNLLKPDPRDTFWPAGVSPLEGKTVVRPISALSSGNAFSLAGVNALLRVNDQSPVQGLASVLLLDLPAVDRP